MNPKARTEVERTIGARVVALRKLRGVSQITLSEALGISFQQVGKYETGENRLSSSRLHDIAKFFDVPISAFFSDDTATVEQPEEMTLLGLPGAVDLLKAFTEINSPELRRHVIALVRSATTKSAQPVVENA